MDSARLDVIYSLLLAHCLSLPESMEKSLIKKFDTVSGREIARPWDEDDDLECYYWTFCEYHKAAWSCLEHHRVHCNPCKARFTQSRGGQLALAKTDPYFGDPFDEIAAAKVDSLRIWRYVSCRFCRGPIKNARCWCYSNMDPCDYFTKPVPANQNRGSTLPEIEFDDYAWHRIEEGRRAANVPRPIKICQIPSEVGMLIAAEWLSRHFDLEGVPGFYREPVRELLPGAPPEDEMIGWMVGALTQNSKLKTGNSFVWRINFPVRMMRASERTGFVVPYDRGTGMIVGIRIYRSVRDQKPWVLSSRGMLGGSRAVAA